MGKCEIKLKEKNILANEIRERQKIKRQKVSVLNPIFF